MSLLTNMKNNEIMVPRMLTENLNAIPRGNTCKGVNRLVTEFLLAEFDQTRPFSILDVPCGNGEFLETVRKFFPSSTTTGADLRTPVGEFQHRFLAFNGERPPEHSGYYYDAVTCISGVMEFDNTLAFFERVREMLDENGVFIVTNDNILSVRDRLMYFFSGRLGQYPFRTVRDGSAWKIIPAQNLVQLLDDAGFEVEKLQYVPVIGPNWVWLVIALPLFLLQSTGNADPMRKQIFSLRSFMSRHYVIVCRPKSDREPEPAL